MPMLCKYMYICKNYVVHVYTHQSSPLDGVGWPYTSTAPRGMIPLVRGGSVGLNSTILEA